MVHNIQPWGNAIPAARDCNEIRQPKDIDAVTIGTPDDWHMQVLVGAMSVGKEVYCEKPMIQPNPITHPTGAPPADQRRHVASVGYSDHYDRLKNWMDAIRSRQLIVEYPVFGSHGAGTVWAATTRNATGELFPQRQT